MAKCIREARFSDPDRKTASNSLCIPYSFFPHSVSRHSRRLFLPSETCSLSGSIDCRAPAFPRALDFLLPCASLSASAFPFPVRRYLLVVSSDTRHDRIRHDSAPRAAPSTGTTCSDQLLSEVYPDWVGGGSRILFVYLLPRIPIRNSMMPSVRTGDLSMTLDEAFLCLAIASGRARRSCGVATGAFR
jgi:hypothetical protein